MRTIDFGMTVRIAVRALRVHKLRSLLTMLGIIIGVGAVVAMVSVGQGASMQVTQRIASLGSNVLQVFPGSSSSGGARGGAGSMTSLTLDDARAIAPACPDVAAVAPIVSRGAQVVYGNQNWFTSVTGTSPVAFSTRTVSRVSPRASAALTAAVMSTSTGSPPIWTFRVRMLGACLSASVA